MEFPKNADNIHRTWIFPQNADISTILSTTRTKLRNLTHNFIIHLYLLFVTQHHLTFTPRPLLELSLTYLWHPLPRCPPGAFYILHTTVWVLRACFFFIWKLEFKNALTISGIIWTTTQPTIRASPDFEMDGIFTPLSRQTVIMYWLLWDRSWRTFRTRTISYKHIYLPYIRVHKDSTFTLNGWCHISKDVNKTWRYYWGSSSGNNRKSKGSAVIFSQIVWTGKSRIVCYEENY